MEDCPHHDTTDKKKTNRQTPHHCKKKWRNTDIAILLQNFRPVNFDMKSPLKWHNKSGKKIKDFYCRKSNFCPMINLILIPIELRRDDHRADQRLVESHGE